nr:sodium/hydrogen exchanger 8 isoform X2 [Parasteatoda tepidariorum]
MGNETNMSYSVAENKTFNSSSFFSEEYLSGARSVQFIMCCLFAGIIIDFGSKKFNFPYTVSCFIFGACIGLLDLYSKFIHSFTLVARMNPSDIMLLFLPFLVFESSFNMNPHMFKKALPQSLVVAIPGTGMPHSFIMLVESESLLNDGISILLYEKLSYQIISPGKMNIAEIIWDFIKTSIGAPLIGYFFGKISDRMLQCVYISPVSEMSMTLIMAYITYFVAEYAFGVSSVLAVLLFGMTLSANKMSISPESENLIQIYWKILNIFANTLIFVFAGVIISVYVAEYHDLWDTIFILITYFGINIIRFLMVIIFYPILYWTGYSLTYQESIILAWSGLRSGFCLTLALLVAFDPEFPESENASKVTLKSL